MKSKIISLIFVVAIVLSVAISSPVFAWGISPAEVTFNVSANGSVDQYFNVTDINGSIMVSMEGIPLSVNPSVVDVDASGTTKMIKITINGDESLGEQTFSGTIDFLPRTNASVAFGIKVLTTVHQFASASQLEQNPIPTATAIRAIVSNDGVGKKSSNYDFVWIIFGCMLFLFITTSVCVLHKKRAK